MRPDADDLDLELRDLLAAAAPGVKAPLSSRERVAESLARSIATLAPSPNGPRASEVVRSPKSLAAARLFRPIAVAFLAGAAAGAAGYRALDGSMPARIVYVETPIAADARPTPAPPATRESAPAPEAPAPTPSPNEAPRSASKRASSASSRLDAERKLLDPARRALAAGRSDDALEAVADHAREFPDGLLVEEREALAVNALVLASRHAEARERADRFVRRFPQSMLRESVEAAISTIR
jgi:hypothetical protein